MEHPMLSHIALDRTGAPVPYQAFSRLQLATSTHMTKFTSKRVPSQSMAIHFILIKQPEMLRLAE
jgi:hypothetical protein